MAHVLGEELTDADRIWHLGRSGLMDGLSPADLSAVVSGCTDRIYSKEEIIFDQGDSVDSVFILNRGSVRISIVHCEDRERILDIYSMGIIGENLLTPSQCFEVRATAHEESWVSIISHDEFIALIRQRGTVALNYAKILCQRLLEAREDIKSSSFLDTEHRLGQMLLRLAERYGKPILGKENMVKLRISLSHEYLARLIATNRTYVSTIMSKFKRRGWIDYEGRRLLIHPREIGSLVLPQVNGCAL